MNAKLLLRAIAALGISVTALAAHATPATLVPGIQPLITAGAPPDTPGSRIDANLPTSPFSGVVSLNIRYSNGDSFICSGAMITPWHVLTAAHCVDSNGQGQVININQPGNDVRAVFNASNILGDPGRAIITANQVLMHSDYNGFGVCPTGMPGFCVNDDIAIVRLAERAPDAAAIYDIYQGPVNEGTTFTMVGYGTSGDGWDGYYVSPAFRVKRSGANVFDFAEANDEAGFDAGSAKEVWYADFDGVLPDGSAADTFCDPSVLGVAICGASLGNGIEANIGGGDSGGPSFVMVNGRYQIVANNTFGFAMGYSPKGGFGDGMGGILLDSYDEWITAAVPEPGSLALVGLAFAAIGATRRRRS